jgi:hypothetical protein
VLQSALVKGIRFHEALNVHRLVEIVQRGP